MNATENFHILNPELSHEARSVYMLFLRPRIERGCTLFSLMEIANYLENHSQSFPIAADLEKAEQVLGELERVGFVRRSDPAGNFESQELVFPFFTSPLDNIPDRPFLMTSEWRPGPSFGQACLICGLEDQEFTERELRDFTSYWASKPEKRVQIAWERAFVQRLLKSREAKRSLKPQYRSPKRSRSGQDGIPIAEAPRGALYTAAGETSPVGLQDLDKLFGD